MDQLSLTTLLIMAGATGILVLVLFLPTFSGRNGRRAVANRFARYARRGSAESANTETLLGSGGIFETEEGGTLKRLVGRASNRLANIGGARAVRIIAIAGCVAGGCALSLTLVWLRWDPVLALPASLGGGSGAMLCAYMQLKRRWQIAFLNNLADAIDLMVRAVRSGIPVAEAIRTAGREINEPVRSEFQRIADSIDLGIDLKEALRAAADRIRLPDFDFLVVALIIQRETGGQLAETMEGLSLILRRRKELRMKIRAMTAEGRMSAFIVSAMPIAAGTGMYLMDPDHVGRLFEPGTGQTMLYSAVTLMGVGIAVVFQMTKVKP
jgi:tight adherence protein B